MFERDIRVTRARQTVSGSFGTVSFAQAYRLIFTDLQAMAVLGCSPPVAITVAMRGSAVEYFSQDTAQPLQPLCE